MVGRPKLVRLRGSGHRIYVAFPAFFTWPNYMGCPPHRTRPRMPPDVRRFPLQILGFPLVARSWGPAFPEVKASRPLAKKSLRPSALLRPLYCPPCADLDFFTGRAGVRMAQGYGSARSRKGSSLRRLETPGLRLRACRRFLRPLQGRAPGSNCSPGVSRSAQPRATGCDHSRVEERS